MAAPRSRTNSPPALHQTSNTDCALRDEIEPSGGRQSKRRERRPFIDAASDGKKLARRTDGPDS
jgi:hypothetical protein